MEIDSGQWVSLEPRVLTENEEEMLKKQNRKLVSEFKSKKLEAEALKMWDLFYKRNSTNFFKDRHWTFREFDELKQSSKNGGSLKMLEAGCGVGNAIFPILSEIENLFVYACDFSPRAVEFVEKNSEFDREKCKVFHCDLSSQDLTDFIPENSLDVVTLIFVLSAIHPDNFQFVFANIYRVLKPGGKLLLRDYGANDWAMLRFGTGSKISDNFYVRQDGTRAYYFNLNEAEILAKDAGFEILTNEFVLRETVNKKKGLSVPRVFLQGKYRK